MTLININPTWLEVEIPRFSQVLLWRKRFQKLIRRGQHVQLSLYKIALTVFPPWKQLLLDIKDIWSQFALIDMLLDKLLNGKQNQNDQYWGLLDETAIVQ